MNKMWYVNWAHLILFINFNGNNLRVKCHQKFRERLAQKKKKFNKVKICNNKLEKTFLHSTADTLLNMFLVAMWLSRLKLRWLLSSVITILRKYWLRAFPHIFYLFPTIIGLLALLLKPFIDRVVVESNWQSTHI